MKEDNIHRKKLMLLRVANLHKIAPKFKYFNDVQSIVSANKKLRVQ